MVDTCNLDAVLNNLRGTAERGALTMSDSIDLTDTSAVVYEEFGVEVFTES